MHGNAEISNHSPVLSCWFEKPAGIWYRQYINTGIPNHFRGFNETFVVLSTIWHASFTFWGNVRFLKHGYNFLRGGQIFVWHLWLFERSSEIVAHCSRVPEFPIQVKKSLLKKRPVFRWIWGTPNLRLYMLFFPIFCVIFATFVCNIDYLPL